MIDTTHDPALRSWVSSANDPGTDFPIQNLPLGVFKTDAGDEAPRVGAAIGDCIVDVAAALDGGALGALPAAVAAACRQPALNALMALGRPAAAALRRALSQALREGSALSARRDRERLLLPRRTAIMGVPAVVGDYTDFYASIHHATNVGSLFRPDDPLLTNYKWVPIGYHGRASSLVPSGTMVIRPAGQVKAAEELAPRVGPSRALDYELELGVFIAGENALGDPVPLARAEERLFGLCLVNDWSARDIQSWEYQPLGPFLGKSFTTTVSPWVVTLDALEPFRTAGPTRPDGDPALLPYLDDAGDRARGGFEITLNVEVSSAAMRTAGIPPLGVARARATDLYWTLGQMVAHHTSNGCNLRPGDLLASGTVSGPTRDALGSLLELTRRGAEPLSLPDGTTRAFLEDGDEVTLTAFCEAPGYVRIGFGECRGTVRQD